ncbi:MAG TPA: ABC transporter permease [Thermoanaerobaculia bacterium]|jgi:putative ABC transport system permease protein|nr:ABC transporter permease [Thermoanaerobaculia bacterium]
MKFLGLLLANFKRHRLRTTLTILSIIVAFILFGYLAAIRRAFQMGASVAGADRLVTRHKISIIQLLPISYKEQMEQIPGVAAVTHASWFGGIYKDPKNFFAQMPVIPNEYLKMYPEFILPKQQFEAWTETRTGVVAGRYLADRFGWRIGDKIPIQSTIWRPKNGGDMWTFDLVGIYDGRFKETDNTQFLFRYDYFDENRAYGQGMVGWYYIRVKDPAHAADVARAIDDHFANSPYETKTETEKAFVKGFADQVGNIGAIVTAILTAVFFTILLVAGNTMAQAVRERVSELGVMKAIGFTDGQLLAFILAESCIIAFLGGAIGLGLAWLLVSMGDPTHGALPIFFFPPRDLFIGAVCVVLLGIVAGLLPAVQAMRLNTVEALRRE